MTSQTRVLDYTFLVLAVVLGVGSIALLVVAGLSPFMHFGWSDAGILLWDSFLSLLFFAQHSGMVRRPFRARLATILDPRYQGATYTISSGLALAIVVVFWQRSETSLVVLEGIPRYLLTVCTVLAVFVFALSAYSLRSFDPLGIGPIRAHLRGVEHQPGPFVVRGPYRWVRHPLYICVIVLFWAEPNVTLDRLLFNVLWTAWICVGTVLEERDLIREFGDTYRQYQKTVPMLIPWRGSAPKSGLHVS